MVNGGVAVRVPEIMVPAAQVKMEKWSVVACDQFSSQPEYWHDVERLVGSAPSMYNLILPEAYLGGGHTEEEIAAMKKAMGDYLAKGVFESLPRGVILTERAMGNTLRKGILLCVDLEEYDYDISKRPQIRATEKTLLERIPPRMVVRRDAALEAPHIMLLMDDPEDSVIGPLHTVRDSMELLYDFELMMGGGALRSYFTESEKLVGDTMQALMSLEERDGMRFCVGDGNHSLATAKAVWDEKKEELSDSERATHPLRYALCEFVNIRDRGIEFKPIHRVLFGVSPSTAVQYLVDRLNEDGAQAKLLFSRWRAGAEAAEGNQIPFLHRDGSGRIIIGNMKHPLIQGVIQDYLEDYIRENPSAGIDYIHGDGVFEGISRDYDNLGLYMPAIKKEDFFDLVISCGVLPKKTFSMGEAEEKRYYTECRLLIPKELEESPAQGEASLEEEK